MIRWIFIWSDSPAQCLRQPFLSASWCSRFPEVNHYFCNIFRNFISQFFLTFICNFCLLFFRALIRIFQQILFATFPIWGSAKCTKPLIFFYVRQSDFCSLSKFVLWLSSLGFWTKLPNIRQNVTSFTCLKIVIFGTPNGNVLFCFKKDITFYFILNTRHDV